MKPELQLTTMANNSKLLVSSDKREAVTFIEWHLTVGSVRWYE
jgi:hypothetical protein